MKEGDKMTENKKETTLEEQLQVNTALLMQTLEQLCQIKQFLYDQHNWLYNQPKYQGKIKSL